MAAPGGDVFEEHLGVIEALKENYMRRDDAMTIANINSLREQVAQLCRAREVEVKDAIKEMSLRVQAAEVEATYPEPEDAHALKIEGLEATTSTAREGVDHLTEQLQELEVQRTAVKEHLQQLADKEKELEKLIDTVEPRIRHTLSLYAHVSKIIWNFEHCDRISGVIDDPSQSNMDTFDLGEEVTFESVQSLWGIVGGGKKS